VGSQTICKLQTEEFAKAIDQLIQIAKKKRSAIMCAESLPWNVIVHWLLTHF
jgi:hypothetical protein